MFQALAYSIHTTAVFLLCAASCHAQGAPNIQQLSEVAKSVSIPLRERFSFSGSYGQSKIAEIDSSQRIASLSSKWTGRERSALRDLQKSATKYFRIHAADEAFTAAADVEILKSNENRLRDEYTASLERFTRGELPRATMDDLEEASAELRIAYEVAISRPSLSKESGTIYPQGVHSTERVWLQYCDAWVIFGAVKWPQVSEESWRTWLTRERTRHLVELAEAH